MKIKFNDGMEYEVFSVAYLLDENGIPVDIIIYGIKEVLEQIAEYASIGINIQEYDWENAMQSVMGLHYLDHICNALYARLKPFTIIEADKVQYTALVKQLLNP